MRLLTLAAGAIIVAVVVGVLWIDEGEVVTLITVDDEGRSRVTGLWIVEIDGQSYLRAGSPDALWLERIREHPEVTVTDKGVTRKLRATPVSDVAVRNAVSWAMREKYGFIDAVLVRIIDHSRSVPIRLDPIQPREAARPDGSAASGEEP